MNLQERIKEFNQQCHSILILEEDSTTKEYEIMVSDFTSYWTEHSLNSKKFRAELERVFDIKRRFATWKRNHDKWNTPKTKPTFIEQAINKQNSIDELFKQIDNGITKIG